MSVWNLCKQGMNGKMWSCTQNRYRFPSSQKAAKSLCALDITVFENVFF